MLDDIVGLKNLMEFDTPAYITVVPIQFHYIEKKNEMFSSKTLNDQKNDQTFLDDMGESKL